MENIQRVLFTAKLSGSRHESNVYTYAHLLRPTRNFYLTEGVFTIEDIIQVDDNRKSKYGFVDGVLTRGVGTITDEGLACLNVDMDKLTALGKDLDFLKNKMSLQKVVDLKILTNEETAEWLRRFTECTEVSTNVFELSPAGTDIMGEPIEAKYLSLN